MAYSIQNKCNTPKTQSNQVALIQALATLSYNFTAEQMAVEAGLIPHLVEKAKGRDILSFLWVLDNENANSYIETLLQKISQKGYID